jgi:ariadne-1
MMEQKLATKQKSFECGICVETKNVEAESITLECEHRFCKSCVADYASNLIDTFKCSENQLCCPECKIPISIHILKYVLSEEKFIKYENYLLQNAPGVISNNNEIRVKCPNGKCGFFYLMSKDSQIVHTICVSCGIEFCVNGCPKPHKGRTCQEMKKIFDQEEKKANDDKNGGDLKFTNCPECKAPIEKISGCNHMKCTICQTDFCYICGNRNFKECGHQYVGYQRCVIY